MIPDRTQKYNNGIFLNKSTRKGWSGQQMGAGSGGTIRPYSEQGENWWNCPDCF
jgi:hypothetical protein